MGPLAWRHWLALASPVYVCIVLMRRWGWVLRNIKNADNKITQHCMTPPSAQTLSKLSSPWLHPEQLNRIMPLGLYRKPKQNWWQRALSKEHHRYFPILFGSCVLPYFLGCRNADKIALVSEHVGLFLSGRGFVIRLKQRPLLHPTIAVVLESGVQPDEVLPFLHNCPWWMPCNHVMDLDYLFLCHLFSVNHCKEMKAKLRQKMVPKNWGKNAATFFRGIGWQGMFPFSLLLYLCFAFLSKDIRLLIPKPRAKRRRRPTATHRVHRKMDARRPEAFLWIMQVTRLLYLDCPPRSKYFRTPGCALRAEYWFLQALCMQMSKISLSIFPVRIISALLTFYEESRRTDCQRSWGLLAHFDT